MAYYLVSAKPKPARLRVLRGKLHQHAFDEIRPFGESMTHALENARLREDGFAVWEEEDDGNPPLALEREVALDEYFEELSLTPVQEGTGWEKIARLPWLFPEFTQDTRQAPYALGFTTLCSEVQREELPGQGDAPSWLSGTLLRTGPARFEVGGKKLRHWFDGLAMLHRFGFSGGRVSYANRYLHSEAYEEAMASGRMSRREFATDPDRTPWQKLASWFSPGLTDNANVNVAQWGDGVFALPETRYPVRIDPETLTTFGACEYDRRLKGLLACAHPRYDAARRRHCSFLLDPGSRSYRFFEIDGATRAQKAVAEIQVESPAYVHSFGLTPRYLILVECPLVLDPLRLRFSGEPFIRNFAWQPERGCQFHLIDRRSGAVVRRARGAPFFAFHHVNAFEEGDLVVWDMVVHPSAAVLDQFYLDHLRSRAPVAAAGRLVRFRWRAGEEIASEALSGAAIELPRFDDRRRAGQSYRFAYGTGQEMAGNFLDSLVKLDLEEPAVRTWHTAGCYPGEPVFVPRPGTGREDEGVVLSVVLDTRRSVSFLLMLDAATFQERMRAELPHHVPFGFHGEFVSA